MVRTWSLLVIATTGCFIKPDPPGIAVDGQTIGDDAARRPNYVFVTSGVIQLVHGDAAMNLANADGLCNSSAATATPQLSGHYLAWLSDKFPGPSAETRLRATLARGWMMPDGELFADTLDKLITQQLLGAPHVDENGADVNGPGGPTVIVATGTASNGSAVSNADASCASGSIEVGEPKFVDASWTATGNSLCNALNLRLYCFGTDFNVPVP